MGELLTLDLLFKAVVGAYVLGAGSVKLLKVVGWRDPDEGSSASTNRSRDQKRRDRSDADHDAVVDLTARMAAVEREVREVKDLMDRVEQRLYDQQRLVFFPRSSGQGRYPVEGERGGGGGDR